MADHAAAIYRAVEFSTRGRAELQSTAVPASSVVVYIIGIYIYKRGKG